jgi:hypothetical protein
MDMEDFMWASRIFYSRDEASLIYDYKTGKFLDTDVALAIRRHLKDDPANAVVKGGGRHGEERFRKEYAQSGGGRSLLRIIVESKHALSEKNKCLRSGDGDGAVFYYKMSDEEFEEAVDTVVSRMAFAIDSAIKRNKYSLKECVNEALRKGEESHPEFVIGSLLVSGNIKAVREYVNGHEISGQVESRVVGRVFECNKNIANHNLHYTIREDGKEVRMNGGGYYVVGLEESSGVRVLTIRISTLVFSPEGDKFRSDKAVKKENIGGPLVAKKKGVLWEI